VFTFVGLKDLVERLPVPLVLSFFFASALSLELFLLGVSIADEIET
jgi:hypothetical protein